MPGQRVVCFRCRKSTFVPTDGSAGPAIPGIAPAAIAPLRPPPTSRPNRLRRPRGRTWAVSGAVVALLVLGAALAVVIPAWQDAARRTALEGRLARGDAEGDMRPYAMNLHLEVPYAGAIDLAMHVDPHSNLVGFAIAESKFTIDLREKLEYQVRSDGTWVYRDYSSAGPIGAILGGLHFHVEWFDAGRGAAHGTVDGGHFDLSLDSNGDFSALAIDASRVGKLDATYAVGATSPPAVPEGALRHAVELTVEREGGPPCFVSCDPLRARITEMRHAVAPDELEVRLHPQNAPMVAATLTHPIQDPGLAFAWEDANRDGLVDRGDAIRYDGSERLAEVELFDLWADASVASIHAAPWPDLGLLAAGILGGVAWVRRRHPG
jgi:hypothetical protein